MVSISYTCAHATRPEDPTRPFVLPTRFYNGGNSHRRGGSGGSFRTYFSCLGPRQAAIPGQPKRG